MTDKERIALAQKWWDMNVTNPEWKRVSSARKQLSREGVLKPPEMTMDFLKQVISGQRFDDFDLLVQRILKNKLLGVTE